MEGFSALCFRLQVANLAGRGRQQAEGGAKDDRETVSVTLSNQSSTNKNPTSEEIKKRRWSKATGDGPTISSQLCLPVSPSPVFTPKNISNVDPFLIAAMTFCVGSIPNHFIARSRKIFINVTDFIVTLYTEMSDYVITFIWSKTLVPNIYQKPIVYFALPMQISWVFSSALPLGLFLGRMGG